MAAERKELHRLVDELPEGTVGRVRQLLEAVRDAGNDPVARSLAFAGVLEPEPVADEDQAKLDEAREEMERGDVLSNEELERDLER